MNNATNTVTDKAPKYTHDCKNCSYLGHVDNNDKEGSIDLYHCTQGGFAPTVIARYGDEGHEYMSGIGPAQYAVNEYRLNHANDGEISAIDALKSIIHIQKHFTILMICLGAKEALEKGLLTEKDFS